MAGLATPTAHAQLKTVACLGNTETGDKQVVQAGVSYSLSYSIQGTVAKVRIAGKELDATVDRGSSWKGPWLKVNTGSSYLSFLPEDGGTIKLQLDQTLWFSGNCR
jgi:hypothetical protein